MKIKKFIKQHYRKFISLCLVLSVTVLSAVTVFAYSIPIHGYPPLDYFTSFLSNGNPDFVYNNVPGSGYSQDDNGRYRYWVGNYFTQTVGNGLPYKIQGYVATYDYDDLLEWSSTNIEGYYNIKVHSTKYNSNTAKQPDYVMFRIVDSFYAVESDWYSFNRRDDETFYWTAWYADNIFIPRFLDEWSDSIQLRIQIAFCYNQSYTRQQIGYLSFFVDYFHKVNNPVDVVIPEPVPPQEENTFPKDYETDDIKNGQAAEEELLDSQGAALDTGLGMISNAKSTLTNLASSFSFVSSFMNKLVKDNPFATLVTVSISLGIFGYLLNTFVSMDSRHRAVKARNEKKNNSKSKKGGD